MKASEQHLDPREDGLARALCCLLIILVCFLLLRGTLHEGFPWDYRDATLSFYLAKVRMLLDDFRFDVSSWYLGYKMLRYYPPLSTFLPYVIALITGNLLTSYYVLCFVFYALSCLGVFKFLARFTGSVTAGLFAGVVWSITHVNFVSFQGHYWETARLFGTAMVPWALYYADRAIENRGRREIAATVLLASFTLLSNMLSMLDLSLMLLPFIVIRGIVFPPIPRASRGEFRRGTVGVIRIGVAGVLGCCLWWYVPALLPHGLGAYASGQGGNLPSLPLMLLQTTPPIWMPAVQLPVTILGLLGAAAAVYRQERRGFMLVVWLLVSFGAMFLVGVQPVRLILDVGLSLVLLAGYLASSLVEVIRIALDRVPPIRVNQTEVHFIVFSLVLLGFFYTYLPGYSNLAVVDNTYRLSDEYVTATWLSENVGDDHRVYVMYGGSYRGSQWLNTFYPRVRQVLGGFDQGARIEGDAPFVFDDLVKQGLDPAEMHALAVTYHVRFLVVDEIWMRAHSHEAYEKFNDSSFFRPVDSINPQLDHAEVFEVLEVTPIDETPVEYEYWDEWRFTGAVVSLIMLIIFFLGLRKA